VDVDRRGAHATAFERARCEARPERHSGGMRIARSDAERERIALEALREQARRRDRRRRAASGGAQQERSA
jgi:hypothetical protein